MKKIFILVALHVLISMVTSAQQTIPLYSNEIPNSKPVKDEEYSDTSNGVLIIHKITRPTITIYPAPKETANGTAVIIYPGGGYWIVAAGHEGADVAKEFNKIGVTAFVVKYRIPDDTTMINKEIGPLQDAQRAIQYVRENADQWNISKTKIGILGFSAGGHLASTAGTHFNKAYIDNPKNTSLRPDFMILCYPVISFTDSIGHIGSRDQLLGKNPSQEKIREYSNELQVTKETPPTFLMHAKNDDGVNVKNTLLFAKALSANRINNSRYIYEKGGHGFGLINPTSKIRWMNKVKVWMKLNGWLPK
ncbi:MAG: alpha/beta hydrolase [Chitinophagaceae bacterium]